ncbi:MAG: hypothetical protein AAF446_02040, partial [Pseudomonadota bacterium]
MSKPPILLLTEHPPLAPQQPATGLSVRHTRMAQCWAEEGYAVTYAWLSASGLGKAASATSESFARLPLTTKANSSDELRRWLSQNANAMVVLGYWEFESLLPATLDGPLFLDYVAPRLLE